MSEASSDTGVRHQRVGWLELFYDLVFVVVIERLTHLVHDDPSLGRVFTTIGLTALVWFAWFNVTALTNVRGGIGARGRPFMFASMAGVGVLALGIEPVVEGHPWLFALGYAIARTAIWPLWWRRISTAGPLRALLWGPGLSVLWLLTPLVPEDKLTWAFAALAIAEMNLGVLRPGRDHTMPSLSGPHMVERLGLFLMIVLGESVVQIVNSLDTERSALTWVTGALAMALMCALWWLIYEATMEKAEQAVEKPGANALDFIGGSQLGIVAGLVLLAAGVADAIHSANPEHGGAHLHHGSLACLCLGLMMVHAGTRSLTREAFAIDLGLPKRRRPQHEGRDVSDPAAARAERQRRKEERERRREEHRQRGDAGARGSSYKVLAGGMTQLLTYLIPVILVWKFGSHWAPWVVVTVLLAYVVLALWVQGYGERRIRAYVESGQFARANGDGASTTSNGAR